MPEKKSFSLRLPIKKLDESAGLVTGWAALSSDANGDPVIDWENHHASVDELSKSARELIRDGGRGKAGDMHKGRKGDVVESMVFDKEKKEALGFDGTNLEGWAVTLEVGPDEIRKIKAGDRNEMSIHGSALHVPIAKRSDGSIVYGLSDIYTDEISIVDAGGSGNSVSSPRIVLAKRKPQELKKGFWSKFVERIKKGLTMDPFDELMNSLPDEQKSIIMAKMQSLAQPAPQPAPGVAPALAAPMLPPPAPLPPMPEEVQKRFDATESENKELKKSLDENKAEINKMKDAEVYRGFLAKAKDLPYVAGQNTEVLAKILMAAKEKLDDNEYETIEKAFKVANDTVKESGILDGSGSPINDEASPEQQLLAIAKSLIEKDPKLSLAKAQNMAGHLNPDIYQRYAVEKNRG